MTAIGQTTSLPYTVSNGGPTQAVDNPTMGSRTNDGYSSGVSSVIHNGLIGAGLGAVAGTVVPGVGTLIGAGVGAAGGVGSALIRQPKVADAIGDGMKAALAGATGGALIGTVTPFGPIGGAIAGAAGGLLTGTVSGLLKKVDGGKYSIDSQTTVGGRVLRGVELGAISGTVVGAGAGFMFGGIGALPGAIWGGIIGAVGGAAEGLMSGSVDALTGAKGAKFTSSSAGGGISLPGLPGNSGSTSGSGTSGTVTQSPTQTVTQCAPTPSK